MHNMINSFLLKNEMFPINPKVLFGFVRSVSNKRQIQYFSNLHFPVIQIKIKKNHVIITYYPVVWQINVF